MIYLLETAVGYGLFERPDGDMVSVMATHLFKSTEEAMESSLQLALGEVPGDLEEFVRSVQSRPKDVLVVGDQKLVEPLSSRLYRKVVCVQDETHRMIRTDVHKHFGVSSEEYSSRVLCVAHKMSSSKVKLVPEKIDTMVIQGVGLVGDMDRDINLHCMRLREWYGLHFPELSSVIEDNKEYLEAVVVIGKKEDLDGAKAERLQEVVGGKSERIVRLAGTSMGTSLTEYDIENIVNDAQSVLRSFGFREELAGYVKKKMGIVAPTLSALVGEMMGARMISKAGSLFNLAKMAGSTIQMLGAEKALFQALRNKSNTPKYGIIYGCTLVGQTPSEYKGKIARSLGSKIGIAARVDSYGSEQTGRLGEEMRMQIERRIKQLECQSSRARGTVKRLKYSVNSNFNYDDTKDARKIRTEDGKEN